MAGLSEEPPLTTPEPSRTPSRLSLWAWATWTRTVGLPWAHEGRSPTHAEWAPGTLGPPVAMLPRLGSASALPGLGHDLSPRVSPGPGWPREWGATSPGVTNLALT